MYIILSIDNSSLFIIAERVGSTFAGVSSPFYEATAGLASYTYHSFSRGAEGSSLPFSSPRRHRRTACTRFCPSNDVEVVKGAVERSCSGLLGSPATLAPPLRAAPFGSFLPGGKAMSH